MTTDVRSSARASSPTCGVAESAALKQSTALSYSPLRLKRTPRPHCSWGSTWVGSELAACRNRVWTSVNKDLCKKNKKKRRGKERVRRLHITNILRMSGHSICMFCLKPEILLYPTCVCDTHSGSSDPNLSLSLSLSPAPSFCCSRSFCSHTERYFGLCFSQSRRVSQACLCSDSLVKLTANAIRAVRLSFFSSIHLMKEEGEVGRGKMSEARRLSCH